MENDEQLLHAYTRERSESAFGELVTRHIDFVYSAAFRVINGDSHLAQDVAQTVVFYLGQKAGISQMPTAPAPSAFGTVLAASNCSGRS
jgi:hypothetical protein